MSTEVPQRDDENDDGYDAEMGAGFGAAPGETQTTTTTDDDDPERAASADGKPAGEAAPKGGGAQEDDPEHLRSELSTLRGKYNAEVPRLSEENARLQAQLREAEERAKAAQAATRGEGDGDELPQEVREVLADVEEASPLMVKAFKGYVDARLSRAIGAVEGEVGTIKKRVDEVAAAPVNADEIVARAVHFATIGARHPAYTEIVGSDTFKTFVAGLPEDKRERAQKTLTQGTAAQVIGLLDQYAEAKGKGSLIDGDVVRSRPTAPALTRAAADAGKEDFAGGFAGKPH